MKNTFKIVLILQTNFSMQLKKVIHKILIGKLNKKNLGNIPKTLYSKCANFKICRRIQIFLRFVIALGDQNAVEELTKSGTSLNLKNEDGQTALHVATIEGKT